MKTQKSLDQLELVLNHYDVLYAHGLLSDFDSIRLMQDVWSEYDHDADKLEARFDKIIDNAISDGICPLCRGQLEIFVDNTGFDEYPHFDTTVKCLSCDERI